MQQISRRLLPRDRQVQTGLGLGLQASPPCGQRTRPSLELGAPYSSCSRIEHENFAQLASTIGMLTMRMLLTSRPQRCATAVSLHLQLVRDMPNDT